MVHKFKSERGSITVYVLVAMLFLLAIVTGKYLLANRQLESQISALKSIQSVYDRPITDDGTVADSPSPSTSTSTSPSNSSSPSTSPSTSPAEDDVVILIKLIHLQLMIQMLLYQFIMQMHLHILEVDLQNHIIYIKKVQCMWVDLIKSIN